MSMWTLGTYHPGWWDLRPVQHIFQIAAAIGVLGLAAFPRHRKDAAAVAAFAAAVVLVAQMLASYWFYPYVCWWLPAVMIALFVPRAERAGRWPRRGGARRLEQGGMTWPGSAMTSRPLQRSRRSARFHATDSRSGARRYDVTCARRRE